MLVSSSDGFWRDGLLGAILLRAALMIAVYLSSLLEGGTKSQRSGWRFGWWDGN